MIEIVTDPLDVDDIVRTCDELMENVVANLQHFNRPVPERRYIATGSTAWDCEQLTITVRQAFLGFPGEDPNTPQQCDTPASALILVQLVRCMPKYNARQGNAPTADKLDAFSKELLRDQSALLKSLKTLDAFRGVLADSSITPPDGQYQAVELNVSEMVG